LNLAMAQGGNGHPAPSIIKTTRAEKYGIDVGAYFL
jgi:hypothetical protein